jgi:hypothetical protein
MRAFRAARNAARLHHMAKQAQIGEVKTHRDFAVREGWLRRIVIVSQYGAIILRH